MYSLNVPVPGRVAALACELARELPYATARQRGTHTLSVKRLGANDTEHSATTYSHLEARAREALVGQPAFEAAVTGIEYFPEAVSGPSPVVYLAVESPELVALHERLTDPFEPVEDIEGEGYTPHVTIARGGSLEQARAITEREIDPIRWTVSELTFWDARRNLSVSTVSLPS